VTADSVRGHCQGILAHILPPNTFAIGRTTVFAKDGSSRVLHDWVITKARGLSAPDSCRDWPLALT
jgi:hypothetical protein